MALKLACVVGKKREEFLDESALQFPARGVRFRRTARRSRPGRGVDGPVTCFLSVQEIKASPSSEFHTVGAVEFYVMLLGTYSTLRARTGSPCVQLIPLLGE